MMQGQTLLCSDLSKSVGEPLFGTAPQTETWLLLEYPFPFGSKALEESDLSDRIKSHLAAVQKFLPFPRLVMIKKSSEKIGKAIDLFLAFVNDRQPQRKDVPERYKKRGDFIAKELNQKPDAVADTMAGLEYPSFKEQLTTQWMGDSKTKEEANITKSMMDIRKFLVELGDLPKGSLSQKFRTVHQHHIYGKNRAGQMILFPRHE